MILNALIVASPLTPLENLLRDVLKWLPHGAIGLPWAWSIVALTIIVRLLLVPLTVRQIHSMQNLQRHAPQMKEIQKKYKADKKRQQEELMKFYKENNINPAASCLPLLAQFPVFFSLYLVLKHFPHQPGDNLAWLGLVEHHRQGHRRLGAVLLAIYALSQLASSYFMTATMEKTQRIMLLVLPIAFIPFILNFPVGLVLYWVTTNLWTVGQGLVTRRLMPRPAAPEKRSSRTPPKEVAPAPALAPGAGHRAGCSPRSRARSSARRAERAGDRDGLPAGRGDGRDRRRGEVGRAARAREAAPRDRQGGGPLPGRLRGRARPARRRLRAGARGRSVELQSSPTRSPSARRSTKASRPPRCARCSSTSSTRSGCAPRRDRRGRRADDAQRSSAASSGS